MVAPLVVGVSGAVYRGGFKTKVEAKSYLASLMAIPVIATPSLKSRSGILSLSGGIQVIAASTIIGQRLPLG
jgi:hypothetical protein